MIIETVILALLAFNTVMVLFISKSVVRIETTLRTRRQPPATPSTSAGGG